MYALVRYLEAQRLRYLVAFLVAFWLQAIAVWYFAVILGMGLVVLALSYALRRWSGWRPAALLAAGAGGVALSVALAPVAWPFFVTRKELGLERSAGDALDRSANALAYLTTQGTWLAKLVRIDFVSETTLFPGLLALGARRPGDRPGSGPTVTPAPPRGWPERLLFDGMAASLVVGGADGRRSRSRRALAPRGPDCLRSRPAASGSSRACFCGTRSRAGAAGGPGFATGA